MPHQSSGALVASATPSHGSQHGTTSGTHVGGSTATGTTGRQDTPLATASGGSAPPAKRRAIYRPDSHDPCCSNQENTPALRVTTLTVTPPRRQAAPSGCQAPHHAASEAKLDATGFLREIARYSSNVTMQGFQCKALGSILRQATRGLQELEPGRPHPARDCFLGNDQGRNTGDETHPVSSPALILSTPLPQKRAKSSTVEAGDVDRGRFATYHPVGRPETKYDQHLPCAGEWACGTDGHEHSQGLVPIPSAVRAQPSPELSAPRSSRRRRKSRHCLHSCPFPSSLREMTLAFVGPAPSEKGSEPVRADESLETRRWH